MLKQFRYNRNDMMRNNFNYIAQSEFEQKSLNVAYNTHTHTQDNNDATNERKKETCA